MNTAKRHDFEDEDPFADSFAEEDADAARFEEDRAAEPPQGGEPAVDASVAEASDALETPTVADATPLLADPPAEPEELGSDERSAEEEPFDWSAQLPIAEASTTPETPAKRFDWFGAFTRSGASAKTPSPAEQTVGDAVVERTETAEPAPHAEPVSELEPEPTPDPEAFADAPTVPAVFDDALTEPEPFDLLAPPEADVAFEAPVEPEPVAASPVAEMIASVEAAMGEAVVPRIAIHVFAQTAETAAVAQTAAADRRLQRASTAVRPGGLPEALALYASSPTPALVVLENTAPALQLLADLDRLAEVCDPGTKVVVIGEANDIGLYRELIRRGVSEYLVRPLTPLQLIRTIGALYADPATPFVGRTIAFVGAKGGVGSSTLAHNFAWCLSERIEVQACVVDYDLAFGTAGLDFNQDPVQGLHDALDKPERLDETLIERMLARCTERLSLFAAPATLDDDYEISADAYEEVAAKIRSTAPFMVLDLPHVWSGWMRKTLLSADEVVLVAQPDLASLRNAKNMLELVAKARPNDAPPRLVLNQVGLPGRPEIPLKDFSKALGVEPELVIPFDAKLFGLAANNGQMIAEVNPKAKPSEALVQFAQAITRRAPAPAKPKSLVERLLKGG